MNLYGHGRASFYYRCIACRKVITERSWKSGSCPCGHRRFNPVIPSKLEKFFVWLFRR